MTSSISNINSEKAMLRTTKAIIDNIQKDHQKDQENNKLISSNIVSDTKKSNIIIDRRKDDYLIFSHMYLT